MLSPQLQLMLNYPLSQLPESFFQLTGITDPDIWDVLVIYNDSLEVPTPDDLVIYQVTILGKGFALLTLPKNQIQQLDKIPTIEYIMLPEVMQYTLDKKVSEVCGSNIASPSSGYGVTGKGIYFASIDSGIDYTHPDFINPDGTTRIAYLWDQTIEGTPPEGFFQGAEFSAADINLALKNPALVPSVDELGHGTALCGIAVGNGRADFRERYKGVAPEAELIVVKVGQQGDNEIKSSTRGPRNTEIMMALKYVVDKAILHNKPISILIGFGINEGGHNGNSSLEKYIDSLSTSWRVNVVVSAGNQANKDSHVSGKLTPREVKKISVFIDDGQPYYFATLWKSFIDDFGIVIQSPSGERTDLMVREQVNTNTLLKDTLVSLNFSQASPVSDGEQIIIFLDNIIGEPIEDGNWTIELTGIEILDGSYDIWGESLEQDVRSIRFNEPTKDKTITIPATSDYATSVAACMNNGLLIAPFSGRGYTRSGKIKPDISAPGVNVISASINKEVMYQAFTGSSAAAAFVAGGYLLLLEYGINQVGNQYLFGEDLKAYIIRTAKRQRSISYPNQEWGYGELCIKSALLELSRLYN
ncbi:MAG: hypothetical protein BEN18_08560 [Epulopiscium sp. Nuni2H_MBin001]|nr:MAG: hypothetical protein BEN18_08560 [Epulopiscium sp. Nuni2H_MBin001]